MRYSISLLTAAFLGSASTLPTSAIDLVSTDSSGVQGSGDCVETSVSGDGRFVVFSTEAALLPGDTNATSDIYLKDTVTGQLSIVSLTPEGEVGNGFSYDPVISASGTHVAFVSEAEDLVDVDTNGEGDIFVRDLAQGETTLVSVSSTGVQGNGSCEYPALSSDGSIVAFTSRADNLVPNGDNSISNVYVRLLGDASTLELLSRNLSGEPGNGACYEVAISGDGDWIAFESDSDDLIEGDVEGFSDVFLCARGGGTVQRISGDGRDDFSTTPSLSENGEFVTYRNRLQIYLYTVEDGSTSVVSVNSNGEESDNGSGCSRQAITSDGRFVVFRSGSSGFGGSGEFANGYLRDRLTGRTICFTNTSDGAGPDEFIESPGISADGSTIVFGSRATNLIANDTNGSVADIFSVKVSDLFRVDNSAARAALLKKISKLKKKSRLAGRKKQVAKVKRFKKKIKKLTLQLSGL